jgi:hypothetical protein
MQVIEILLEHIAEFRHRFVDLGDLLSEDGEVPTGGATKQPLRQTPTPTSGYMSIPRPPSRRSDPSRHINQSNISRADSISSLEFRTACVPVGVSRGPSPLTIGMADTIPLAVAFHEIVHSYFRGADETRYLTSVVKTKLLQASLVLRAII